MRTRQYKANLEELEDGYQEARDTEFHEQFCKFILENDNFEFIWTEDELQGFLDTFEFESVSDWCASEYQSRLEDYEDQKYQEYKERDIC